MLRSILIRIHMSRIIVYLDRDLNIFQVPRGEPGRPAGYQLRKLRWTVAGLDLAKEQWLVAEMRACCVTMCHGDAERESGGDQACSTHFHSRGGGRKWRRRRHSQADVRSPYFCRAICTGTADLCTTHNTRASLIVSAAGDNKTESLNLLFTRSLKGICRGQDRQ